MPAYSPPTSTKHAIAYARLLRSLWIKSSRFSHPSRILRETSRLAGRVMQYISTINTNGERIFPMSQAGMGGSVAP